MTQNEKIAAIVGLTEAIKQYGIPSEYSPTIAIMIGAFIGYSEQPDAQGILQGALLGAATTGGYAVTKRVGRGATAPFIKNPDYSQLEADDYRGV
jgi:hypothetical protein